MGKNPARTWLCRTVAAASRTAVAALLAAACAPTSAAAAVAAALGSGAVEQGPLAEWLQALTFEVPAFRWGPMFPVRGGSCWALRARRVEATDLGGPRAFQVAYRVSGLGFRCRLLALDGTLTVSFELEDSMAEFQVSVKPQLLRLPVGQVALPLGEVTVSQCSVRTHLQRLAFEGTSILTPGLELSRQNIRRMFEQDGPAMVCEELQGRLASKATQILQDVADSLMTRASAATSLPPAPAPAAPLVDWAEYPPLQLARAVLVERADVLARLARRRGALMVPVQLDFGGDMSVGSPFRSAAVRVESLELDGPAALAARRLALRGQGSRVDLSLAYESLELVLHAVVDVELAGAKPLRKELNLTLALDNASLDLRALAMVSRPALEGLSVEQLQHPSCLAGCAGRAVPPSSSPLGLVDFALSALPGLRLAARGPLEAELAALGDATLAAALRGYEADFQSLVHAGIGLARLHLDAAVRGYLGGAPACEPAGGLELGHLLVGGLPWVLVCIAAVGLLGVGAAVALPHSIKVAAIQGEMLSLEDSMCEDSPGCGAESGSLSSQAAVSRAASLLFPATVVATMALFAYADLGLGTVINVVVTASGRTMTVGPAFAFSLVSCVADSWGAGAYGIAALVGLLSGVWPFAKLGLLLFAWWAPLRYLRAVARGRLLGILDALGKYSLVDSWLAIIALASYRMDWHSTTEAASLAVDSVPMAPFFAFVLAAVLSLVLGHVASEYHRRAGEVECGSRAVSEPEPLQRPLSRAATAGAQLWLAVGLLLAAAAVVAGACVTSFHMVLSGAVAELLLDPEDTINRYSLVSLGSGVTLGKPGDLGLRMVQLVFFAFTFAIPLAVMGMLLFLWIAPLRRPAQEAILHICKALDAWASFDVFALAVAVSHFEFGLLSTFLVYYDNLSTLCGWVRDDLKTECFHIECSLAPGFAIVAIAGILSTAVPKAALRICEAALDDEDEEACDLLTEAGDSLPEAVAWPNR